MRWILATVVLTFLSIAARAEPAERVRIIEITKENAERSAAALAAAKSPFIGMPPRGKIIHAPADWRDARAQLSQNGTEIERSADDASGMRADNTVIDGTAGRTSGWARVQVIKPGKTGQVVETYLVPRQ